MKSLQKNQPNIKIKQNDKWIEFNFPIELSKSHSLWNVLHALPVQGTHWAENDDTTVVNCTVLDSTCDKKMIYFQVTNFMPINRISRADDNEW